MGKHGVKTNETDMHTNQNLIDEYLPVFRLPVNND